MTAVAPLPARAVRRQGRARLSCSRPISAVARARAAHD